MLHGHLHHILYFKKPLCDNLLDHNVLVEATSHSICAVTVFAVDLIIIHLPQRVCHYGVGVDLQQSLVRCMRIQRRVQLPLQVRPFQLLSQILGTWKPIDLLPYLLVDKAPLLNQRRATGRPTFSETHEPRSYSISAPNVVPSKVSVWMFLDTIFTYHILSPWHAASNNFQRSSESSKQSF